MSPLDRSVDVVVVGAGVVGAACAYYAAQAGLDVAVVDAGGIAAGTSSAGEGNLLVSDKQPGPELDLMLRSLPLWAELASTLDTETGHLADQPGPHATAGGFEYELKGGLVVAETTEGLAGLDTLAAAHRAAGVVVETVPPDDLRTYEPELAGDLAGGMFYPQDAQVQPMLAAAHLLRAARRLGARFHPCTRLTAVRQRSGGGIAGVVTTRGTIATPALVNAAGTWGGDVAALAGVTLPVLPRRGFILVTEPLPPLIRHKVYDADYVANVASDSAGLETSAVVESTASGTVLIGASRERVGFDRTFSLPVLSRLAAQAVRLFPFLAGVPAIRTYRGFRPYTPDHLPVIGSDPRVEGLVHACGHEGAGVGLAPVTGWLVAELLAGRTPELDLRPFRPERFDAGDSTVRGDTTVRSDTTVGGDTGAVPHARTLAPPETPRGAAAPPGTPTPSGIPTSSGTPTPSVTPAPPDPSAPAGPAEGLVVDGRVVPIRSGQSIAAALLDAGLRTWRTTRHGAARGVFCGIGVCYDCVVTVNGRRAVRACLVEARPGDVVTTESTEDPNDHPPADPNDHPPIEPKDQSPDGSTVGRADASVGVEDPDG